MNMLTIVEDNLFEFSRKTHRHILFIWLVFLLSFLAGCKLPSVQRCLFEQTASITGKIRIGISSVKIQPHRQRTACGYEWQCRKLTTTAEIAGCAVQISYQRMPLMETHAALSCGAFFGEDAGVWHSWAALPTRLPCSRIVANIRSSTDNPISRGRGGGGIFFRR